MPRGSEDLGVVEGREDVYNTGGNVLAALGTTDLNTVKIAERSSAVSLQVLRASASAAATTFLLRMVCLISLRGKCPFLNCAIITWWITTAPLRVRALVLVRWPRTGRPRVTHTTPAEQR